MGICCSSSYNSQPTTPSTAKVIHQDGLLQEFNYPVKVSHIINPHEIFICNSDEMDFGDVVSPLSTDSEVQLGQLYFALPVNRLSQPLSAEEMAALAVKAHAALMKNGLCRESERVWEEGKVGDEVSSNVVSGMKKKVEKSRRKVFAANLSTINEE